MKVMICEVCGRQGLNKQDGQFLCPDCGTGYSLEEAKKLLQEVEAAPQPEEPAQTGENKYLLLARQAAKAGNNAEAAKYYALGKEQLPDDWECVFYSNYYTALNCTVGKITQMADMVGKTAALAVELVKKAEAPNFYFAATRAIATDVYDLFEIMADSADYKTEREKACVFMICNTIDAILTTFADDRNVRFGCSSFCSDLLDHSLSYLVSEERKTEYLHLLIEFRKEDAAAYIDRRIADLEAANISRRNLCRMNWGAVAKMAIPAAVCILAVVRMAHGVFDNLDNPALLLCWIALAIIGVIFTIATVVVYMGERRTPEYLQQCEEFCEENNKKIEWYRSLLK